MRNANKANQRHVHQVMQKQAQYERELYSGRRELPSIRHANRTVHTLFNQWTNLSLSQQFLIALMLSTVIFPVASGSHEYNSAAPVLKNPYAVVPKSFLSQFYTELSNFFFSSQSEYDVPAFTSISECHYLVPLTLTSYDQEERTVMCVRNFETPNLRRFKEAEQSAIEFMRLGKKANYLAVLAAWPKKERLQLIKSIDEQIAYSKFPLANDKLSTVLPKEGLYDHPYSMVILSDWVQVANPDFVLHYRFSQDQLALNFNILKTNTSLGYQWLQVFMAYCLLENNEQAALLRIEAFIKRGIAQPQLVAENALVTNAISRIRNIDATPLSPKDELAMTKMSTEINDQQLPTLTVEDRQRALLMITYSSLFTHACNLGKLHIVEYFLREPELTSLTADDVANCLALARINQTPVYEAILLAFHDPKIAHLKSAEGKSITEVDKANNERLTQYEMHLTSHREQAAAKYAANQQASPSRASSSMFYHRLDEADESVLGQTSEKIVVLTKDKRRAANIR